MGQPTTTAYAILGLIAVRQGSAYDLAHRMERNYRYIWPGALSHFYTEIKRLVGAGLASATVEQVGRRPRSVYRITPEGHAALAAWIGQPASPPLLEFEGLLRVAYADFGTKQQLLQQLEAIRDHADRVLSVGIQVAVEYASAQVELPQRAHTSRLLWTYLWSYHQGLAEWARSAIDEVDAWPDTQGGPLQLERAQAYFRETIERVLGAPSVAARSAPAAPQARPDRKKSKRPPLQ
jgi:PadR family transcriptional regulator, regulatory protein AphA